MPKLNPFVHKDRMRVAIYIRVSTDEQAREGHSLDAQLKICHGFAEARGWEIAGVFRDPENPDDFPPEARDGIRRKATSSGKTDKRPGFQKLLAAVRRGGADVVLTHKLDRFSRNITDILLYMREFNKLGVAYTSATEQFDFTTPIGKVMLTMLAAFAEWYLDNLSSETKKGKRARAEKGYWNGDLPFGYQRAANTRDAELNTKQAAGVRLAFTEYAKGSYRDLEIARILNRADYRTKGKRGSIPFSKDTVRSMLQNVFYTGKVKYKSEEFAGRHPAIISNELFEQCQAVRRRWYSRPRTANPSVRTYPLAGLIYCSECKRPQRGQYLHHYRYYRDPDRQYDGKCQAPSYVQAEQIEQKVSEALAGIDLPPRWRDAVMAKVGGNDTKRSAENARARAKTKLERARELYVEGLMTRQKYDAARREVQGELDATKPVAPADFTRVALMLGKLRELWQYANAEERKTLFNSMLERVYVKGSELIAIQPRPELWALMLVVYCGPDGIRLPMRKLYRTVQTINLLQTPLSHAP